MIVKIQEEPHNKYGRFFLATEAPDDEKEGAEVTKTTATPDDETEDFDSNFNDLADEDFDDDDDDDIVFDDETDFNSLGLDSDDDQGNIENEPVQEENPQPEEPVGDGTDNTEQNESPDDEQSEDSLDNPNDDETDAGATGDESGYENQDTDFNDGETDADVTGDESGYEDQDTDFNDDETPTDDTDQEADGDTPQQPESKGPGVEYDSTRKYNLFKEFMSLYTALENYISKLENNVKDDLELNQINKMAVENLRELKDLTYDYMTIKFDVSTYVQSLVFYQLMVVGVQSVFNLINSTTKTNQIKNSSTKH